MKPADAGPDAALWRQGWYRFARALPSPNFGPRPAGAVVDLLVIHSISLPPGVFGGGHVQQLFTNQLDWDADPSFAALRGLRVSAHFLIERDGALWQFVDCDQRAWHAGVSSHRGRDNCNDYSIGIELAGLEGGRFEADQYETLVSLCAALRARHPIGAVAGHQHVAPGRKQDPGRGFDWAVLRRAIGAPGLEFPALDAAH